MLKMLDLFSGIGGFSLAAKWTGQIQTVAFCEIEPFCQKVLAKNFPGVQIHDDIKRLRGDEIGAVDIITGGFPCQPFSTASRGRRVAEDLWPEMYRVVSESKPRIVIAENVQRNPIARASRELESIGYATSINCIAAHRLGAWHKRDRWFLVAYTDHEGELQGALNAKMAQLQGVDCGFWNGLNHARAVRVFNGVPRGVDRGKRLKSLGNSVVPQAAYIILDAIVTNCKQELFQQQGRCEG